jgi:hypothetical protein
MIWLLIAFYARRSAFYTHAHSLQECPWLDSEEEATDELPEMEEPELPAPPITSLLAVSSGSQLR